MIEVIITQSVKSTKGIIDIRSNLDFRPSKMDVFKQPQDRFDKTKNTTYTLLLTKLTFFSHFAFYDWKSEPSQ